MSYPPLPALLGLAIAGLLHGTKKSIEGNGLDSLGFARISRLRGSCGSCLKAPCDLSASGLEILQLSGRKPKTPKTPASVSMEPRRA